MANLTKEFFEKHLDERLDARLKEQSKELKVFVKDQDDKLEKSLKAFIQEQDEELARIVNKGFEHTIKQLDVLERMARLEKVVYKIADAINLKVA